MAEKLGLGIDLGTANLLVYLEKKESSLMSLLSLLLTMKVDKQLLLV